MTARREKQQRRSAVRSGPGRDSRSPRVVRARMPWPWIMAGFAAMVLAAVLIVRVMVPARTTAPVAVAMRPP